MSHKQLTFLLTILMSLEGINSFAQDENYYDVEVEGLYYRLTNDSYWDDTSNTYYDGTATIVNPNGDGDDDGWELPAYQEGELIIPSSITVYDDNPEYWESAYQKTYCVTTIGEKAFYGCLFGGSAFVPSSVTMIGDYAFSDSYGLTSIIIPSSVISIGNSAFRDCSSLTSVDIPNSVTSIGDETFYGCRSLSSVTIPNSVTSIGDAAFEGCTNLTGLTIPNTVTSIGKSAFRRCSNLKILNIPNSVTSIEEGAFNGCSGLTSVNIPISVNTIGRFAFQGCSGKLTVNCNIPYEAFRYSSFNEVIIGNNVTNIGSYAFSGCSRLTNISIPNCVTSIGYQAFYACNNLASVTIGNSVAIIGNEAFEGTAWYENQPNGMVYAGRVAYKYKGTMPENTSLTIKEGTLGVAEKAFYECDKLIAITIPEGATTIGSHAFGSCKELKSITIPKTIEQIGDMAFYMHGWDNTMTSVYITDLKSWFNIEFSDIESNPIAYGGHLILNGEEVKKLVVPDGVTSINDNAFYSYYNLTSVTIPSSVSYIGKYSFRYCYQITSLNLSEGLKTIGESAFESCSGLTSVIIPSSVTSIGNYAFSGCSDLTNVKVGMETPLSITSNTFSNRTNASLYVPTGCKAAYEAADYWKNFKEIIEMEPAGVETTDISQMDNVIYIKPSEARCGSQTTLSVKMKNNVPIQTMQFDLYLPDGITVVPNEDDELMTASKERINRFNYFESSMQFDGALRLLAQATSTNVPVGDGEICRIVLDIPENMEEGDYPLVIKGALMVEMDNTSHSPDPNLVQTKLTVLKYVLGDANNDGDVNAIDFNMIGNYILGRTQNGFNMKAADISGDGDVNAIDFNMVGNMILNGSTASARERRLSTNMEKNNEPQ